MILAYLPKNFYSKTGVESNTFKFNKINNCFTPPERNRAFNFFIVVDLDMKFALCPVKICCVSKFVVFPDLLCFQICPAVLPNSDGHSTTN